MLTHLQYYNLQEFYYLLIVFLQKLSFVDLEEFLLYLVSVLLYFLLYMMDHNLMLQIFLLKFLFQKGVHILLVVYFLFLYIFYLKVLHLINYFLELNNKMLLHLIIFDILLINLHHLNMNIKSICEEYLSLMIFLYQFYFRKSKIYF